MNFIILTFIINLESGFSSVGRAFDCRGNMEIKGSLVQIREAGFFFPINIIIIPNKEIIINNYNRNYFFRILFLTLN